ncbi:MAG: HAD family phosphatase [Candidatus Kaiserbacteria bacterium]|nr:HAD family phosphatase [Candidatus Kaiserbacteria bacterium]
MDGVVARTERIQEAVWLKFFNQHGIALTPHDVFNMRGMRPVDVINEYFPKTTADVRQEMAAERSEISKNALRNSVIAPVDGIADFVHNARKNSFKVALATSAHRDTAELILNKVGLRDCFDVIISAEDVTRGKPDPEVYEKTALQLCVQPKECIVFEDAASGIQSAKRAGMKVVGLLTSHTKEELAGADDYLVNFAKTNADRYND